MQLWMYEAQKRNDLHPLPVSMTLRSHLFSYRTQKLSSVVQKVLGWTRPGRICRCRFPKQRHTQTCMSFVLQNENQIARHTQVSSQNRCNAATKINKHDATVRYKRIADVRIDSWKANKRCSVAKGATDAKAKLASLRASKKSDALRRGHEPGRICRCRFPKEKHTRLSVFFFYNGYLVSERSDCRVQPTRNCKLPTKR